MEVDRNWEDEVRAGILAITEELAVRATLREVRVMFPPPRAGLGRLGVEWYDKTRRAAFRLEWPAHMRPTVEWICALARVKIEHVLAVMRGSV